MSKRANSLTDLGNPFADLQSIHVIALSPEYSLRRAPTGVLGKRRVYWDALNEKLEAE